MLEREARERRSLSHIHTHTHTNTLDTQQVPFGNFFESSESRYWFVFQETRVSWYVRKRVSISRLGQAQGHVDINAQTSISKESENIFVIQTNEKRVIRIRAENSNDCDMWVDSIRSCVYEMQRFYITEKAKSSVYNPDVVSMVAMEGLKQLVKTRGGTQNVSKSMLRRKLVKSFGEKTYSNFFSKCVDFNVMIADIERNSYSINEKKKNESENEEDAIKSRQKLQIENLNETDQKIVRDVFWMIVSVLEQPMYDMRGLFVTGMPRLEFCLFAFEKLLHEKERALGEHLTALKDEIQVPIYPTCRLYATQWFMTFFARDFPLELSLQVWDIFLLEGWPIVFKIAIALMKRSARHIRNLDFETSLQYLQHDLPHKIDVNNIMKMARSIDITDFDMGEIELEFEKKRPSDEDRRRR
jgi:hypothetical protein